MNYRNIHKWVARHYGKADHCIFCNTLTAKRYHWSNISGAYQQDISDWQQLCVSCHKKYDIAKKREAGLTTYTHRKHLNNLASECCRHGHEYLPENTRWRVKGLYKWRVCLTCQRNYIKNFNLRIEI